MKMYPLKRRETYSKETKLHIMISKIMKINIEGQHHNNSLPVDSNGILETKKGEDN
jgi:hypothetical protein